MDTEERKLLQAAYDNLCRLFNSTYQEHNMGLAQSQLHGRVTIDDICRAANTPAMTRAAMVQAYPVIHELNAALKK